MIGSPKVREARKVAQKARIAAKKKGKGNDYAKFFANQPQQLVKAQINEKIHAARDELKDAAEALQIAEITGDGLLAAQEAAQVANLYLSKLLASKAPGAAMALTAVGAMT